MGNSRSLAARNPPPTADPGSLVSCLLRAMLTVHLKATQIDLVVAVVGITPPIVNDRCLRWGCLVTCATGSQSGNTPRPGPTLPTRPVIN